MNQALASRAARSALIELNIRVLTAKGPHDIPAYCITAKPYLRAIAENNYGLEDPTMCVLYALNNLQGWRGAVARNIKQSLNLSIKENS